MVFSCKVPMQIICEDFAIHYDNEIDSTRRMDTIF